ncbi:MAG: hypothetical protein JNK82_35575 [Myxococcaceae bacterium]|nr:hypothetical protein [Myxococcaceae bacterium]
MTSRAAVAVLVLAACDPGEPEPQALESAEQQIRTCEPGPADGIIVGNSMSTADLMFNPLLVNRTNNALIQRRALATGSFNRGDTLTTALTVASSVRVLDYLVGCALSANDAPVEIGSTRLYGKAGLCREWAVLPDGVTLSAKCLEQVSACMLGRNNALGLHVPLSMRGDDRINTCSSAGGNLHAWDWRGIDGTRPYDVKSFLPCSGSVGGAERNCGWQSAGVLRCTPGDLISVGAGAHPRCGAPLGWASTPTVLRLCEGLSGCDHGQKLIESSETPACGGNPNPSFEYTCPSSGLVNVMSGPLYSGAPSSHGVGNTGLRAVIEGEHFAMREGAFYGTMFDPAALAYEVFVGPKGITTQPPIEQISKPIAFTKMYSCGDSAWVSPSSYMAGVDRRGRTCAMPPASYRGTDVAVCTANYVGTCVDTSTAGCTPDAAADGEMRSCRGGGRTWWYGMTTFLVRACDLTSPNDPFRCARQ